MIKVLHICYGAGTGGVEAVIYNYYSNMDHERIHFDVAAQKGKKNHTSQMYGDMLKKQGCEVFFVPPKSENLLKNLLQMARIIRRGKYDVLHIHMGPASLPYIIIGRLYRVRSIIVHTHDAFDPVGWNKKTTTKILRLIQDRTKNYHRMACTKEAAIQLWGENADAYVLHNAFEIENYIPRVEIRERLRGEMGIENRLALVDVGRLSLQKDPLYMMDVFSALLTVEPNAVLFMIGTGEMMGETRKYAEKQGLDKTQVQFLGARTDVAELLQAMDIFVLPTRGEGLGIVYIEAQAAGLPCFATKGCVPQDVAITPLFHEVEKTDDVKAWVDAILSHANERMQESPQQLLREAGYDIHLEAGKLEKYYEKLYGGDTGR